MNCGKMLGQCGNLMIVVGEEKFLLTAINQPGNMLAK